MILGLHGRSGAGKNACAERLKLLYPDVVEISIAAKVKETLAALLGVNVGDLELWKNQPDRCVALGGLYDGLGFVPDTAWTIREVLQRLGTEAGREIFGEDFWVDQALPDGAFFTEQGDKLYVVTDVRFPNEARRVKDLGGHTVCVVGPDENTGEHPSEIPLSCDYVLNNLSRDDGFVALDRRLALLLESLSLPVAV